jgi:transposase
MPRKPYPTDVSDEEWSFAAPYLALMTQDAPQREHSLREVFNALRWIVRAGSPWRLLPNDFPPWEAVYQQSRRWLDAGCFEAMVMDLRAMIRFAGPAQCRGPGRPYPAVELRERSAQRLRRLQTQERQQGAHGRRHAGHLLAVHVTPANEQERAHVFELCEAVQTVTGQTVELAWADQGYTGEQPKQDAKAHGIELQVIKLAEAKKGFVLSPKRWVVERSFAWAARFRQLAKDYERLPNVLRGLHFLVFAILTLPKAIPLLTATANA